MFFPMAFSIEMNFFFSVKRPLNQTMRFPFFGQCQSNYFYIVVLKDQSKEEKRKLNSKSDAKIMPH